MFQVEKVVNIYENARKVRGRVLCRAWSSAIVCVLERLAFFLSIVVIDAAVAFLLSFALLLRQSRASVETTMLVRLP